MWDTVAFKGTVLEKCRALKQAGFEGVELASHMDQDEVMRALAETGLVAASVCGSKHWAKPLSSNDEAVRAAGLTALQQTVRDAKRYGATSILLVPGVVDKVVTYEQCWERSIAAIRAVLPLCEETGVKIAIENVWNNFLMKPQQALDYLGAIGSPLVGWHFDTGNMIKFGPSEEWINALGPRIFKLHIKEYSKAKGFGVRFFEGDNNWPAIMAALDKIPYRGWGICEQPGKQARDADALKALSTQLDQIFAGKGTPATVG